MQPDNPFATPSDLPYGLPPFDRITPAHIDSAIQAGLQLQRTEWEAIATNPDPPTLANTLEALERSGQLLGRALTVHWTLSSAVIDPVVQQRDREIAPLLAAHGDALYLDRRIFARVDHLAESLDDLQLSAEERRLVDRTHLAFVRAGAALDDDDRGLLRQLNEQLSTLAADFKALLVHDTNDRAVHVTDRARLAGLTDDAVASARTAARARDLDGWLLTLVLPTGQPLLASLADRSLRQELHDAAVSRCLDGPGDTRVVLTEITALRAERAALLGFADHASYVIADQTAGDADHVVATLRQFVEPAVANARDEQAELKALLHADGHDGPLQPWDWAFYAQAVRRERLGVDPDALRSYFSLDRVLDDGILVAATRLFGISFTRRDDLPAYHSDVRILEVTDHDGTGLGLCLIDPYSRDSKRGGAWMTTLADQSTLLDGSPVVTVTLNVPPPGEDSTHGALMTLDEVTTAFHEFGHALHGLFSAVTYPRFSGTAVPRDFVEFPSQVNEMWAFHPEILAGYALHHTTGEPLPQSTIDQLVAARRYGQGFGTVEYLAAALLDLAWHRLAPGHPVGPGDVEAFEHRALDRVGLDLPAIPPRYRSTYFAHIFAGAYSAGYYAYIWSEMLDAELVEWFGENGGLTRANGDAFRAGVLSKGGSVDALEAFASVRGRAATLDPLLERRGLQPD